MNKLQFSFISKNSFYFWGLLALILLFFPILFQGNNLVSIFHHLVGNDPWGASLYFGKLKFLTQLLHNTTVPFWDPTEAAGRPILGDPEFKLFCPLHWPNFISNNLFYLNAIILCKLYATYIFMYLFLKKIRLDSLSSNIGAFYWIANSYMTGYLNHNHFDTIVLYPLLFLLYLEFAQNFQKKVWYLFTFCLYCIISSGNPQTILNLAILFSLFCINDILSNKLYYLILPLLLSLLCSIFFYSPELITLTFFHKVWYSYHNPEDFLLTPPSLTMFLKLIFPIINNERLKDSIGEHFSTFSLFPVVLIIGNIHNFFKLKHRYFFFVLLFYFLFFFENYLFPAPYLKLAISKIPVINEIRYTKYTENIFFCLCICFAQCIQLRMQPIHFFSKFYSIILSFGFIIFIYLLSTQSHFLSLFKDSLNVLNYPKFTLKCFLSIGLFTLFSLYYRKFHRAFQFFLVFSFLLIDFSIFYVSKFKIHHNEKREIVEKNSFINAGPNNIFTDTFKRHRVISLDNSFQSIGENYFGISMITGGSPTHFKSYQSFFMSKTKTDLVPPNNLIIKKNIPFIINSNILNYMAVKYILVEQKSSLNSFLLNKGQFSLIRPLTFIKNFNVYENHLAQDIIEYNKAMGSIKLKTFENNKMLLQVNLDRPTNLVIKSVYFIGWQAAINQNNISISPDLKHNTFMQIDLPKGIYQLNVKYTPVGLIPGFFLILLGVFIILFMKIRAQNPALLRKK